MNHHLAIKSHAWSCSLEHTKKKHWLNHVAVSEHSTFPCEMSVRLGRVRCTSVAKLEECSWWIYLLTSSQTENLSSVQPGGKESKESLSCTLWGRLSLWVIWCLSPSPALTSLLLSPAVWTPAHRNMDRNPKLSQFKEQLSETTALDGFYTVTWGLGPDPNPLRVFPSSLPVQET